MPTCVSCEGVEPGVECGMCVMCRWMECCLPPSPVGGPVVICYLLTPGSAGGAGGSGGLYTDTPAGRRFVAEVVLSNVAFQTLTFHKVVWRHI